MRASMRRRLTPGLLAAAALCLLSGSSTPAAGAPGGCAPVAAPGYARSVSVVTQAGRDVLGNALLRAPGGPSYERANAMLAPLLLATREGRKPMTTSGVYYVPLAYPTSVGA